MRAATLIYWNTSRFGRARKAAGAALGVAPSGRSSWLNMRRPKVVARLSSKVFRRACPPRVCLVLCVWSIKKKHKKKTNKNTKHIHSNFIFILCNSSWISNSFGCCAGFEFTDKTFKPQPHQILTIQPTQQIASLFQITGYNQLASKHFSQPADKIAMIRSNKPADSSQKFGDRCENWRCGCFKLTRPRNKTKFLAQSGPIEFGRRPLTLSDPPKNCSNKNQKKRTSELEKPGCHQQTSNDTRESVKNQQPLVRGVEKLEATHSLWTGANEAWVTTTPLVFACSHTYNMTHLAIHIYATRLWPSKPTLFRKLTHMVHVIQIKASRYMVLRQSMSNAPCFYCCTISKRSFWCREKMCREQTTSGATTTYCSMRSKQVVVASTKSTKSNKQKSMFALWLLVVNLHDNTTWCLWNAPKRCANCRALSNSCWHPQWRRAPAEVQDSCKWAPYLFVRTKLNTEYKHIISSETCFLVFASKQLVHVSYNDTEQKESVSFWMCNLLHADTRKQKVLHTAIWRMNWQFHPHLHANTNNSTWTNVMCKTDWAAAIAQLPVSTIFAIDWHASALLQPTHKFGTSFSGTRSTLVRAW